jgi:2-keto-4-pentenoate hydratase/2-oxohepta-3-ene-1,7-dioic acid hydratase in catechol pathway
MKILGIGNNLVTDKNDIEKLKKQTPFIFTKTENTLVSATEDLKFPTVTNALIFEIELVIRIGKSAKNVLVKEGINYIDGIAAGIDFTAKDILMESRNMQGPWALAKGFDGASPVSDFKPISNFPDVNNINFSLEINGKQRQVGNTSEMVRNFSEIITYITKFMTLEAGDIIFTGTPALGADLTHIGDHLQGYIEDTLVIDFKMI